MTDELQFKQELELASGHPVVLLVDDQPMFAEAIRRMLVDEPDIDFHYCGESTQALQTVQELKPTLILQDLVMPDIDGMNLVRAYRETDFVRNIPVIVLSNKEDPRDKSHAFSAGANDYLVKLPDKIELVARIRAHSKSFLAQMQRDHAIKKLRELQLQLEASNRELQRLSCLDGLTGIANRRHFDTYLDQEWLRATRDGEPISMILTDLDCFKAYNDNYGHQAGDDCLQKVAGVFQKVLQRPGDMAARYGGEEFVVLLPRTDDSGVSVITESLWRHVIDLDIAHEFSEVADCVTISLGTATIYPSKRSRPSDLIALADKALYEAKKAGRNRYVVATRQDRKRSVSRT